MDQPIAPDALVDHLIENLALNGDDGASIDDLWKFAEEKSPGLDEFKKGLLWKWLMYETTHVLVSSGDNLIDQEELKNNTYEHIVSTYGDAVRVYANEEDQWMRLTGKPKEGNALGALPFQLLCAVSRSRSRGLTNVELARETGQDPRSIFGRIVKLMEFSLVERFPVIHGGMSTHLIVYKKFVKSNREGTNPKNVTGVDVNELQRMIVESVKKGEQGKPGIRQHDDLKKQLKFDVSHRSQITFSQCVRRLEKLGYVKRVVSRAKDGYERYRCIQFVKDLPEDADSDDEYAVDLMNEVDAGGEIDPSDIKEEEVDDVDDENQLKNKDIIFNLHYPLETQVVSLINAQGTEGLPTMDLSRKLVGRPWTRIFARLLENMVDKDPKKKKLQPARLGHLDIMRGSDSDGRVKFYRYYTAATRKELQGLEPDPQWNTFAPIETKNCFKNLAALEQKHATPMPGAFEVRNLDGKNVPLFHGERGFGGARTPSAADSPLVLGSSTSMADSELPSSSSKKTKKAASTGRGRGRPRKRPLSDDESGSASVPATPTPPKKRGRPPKNRKKIEEIANANSEANADANAEASANSNANGDGDVEVLLPPSTAAPAAPAAAESVDVAMDILPVEPVESEELVAPAEPVQQTPQKPSGAPLLAPSAEASELPIVQLNTQPASRSSSGVEEVKIAPELLTQEGEAEQDKNGDVEMSEQVQKALATPRYQRPKIHKKKTLTPADDSLALATIKRQTQILGLLEKVGGAIEAGTYMTRQLNEFVNDKTSIDRRTVRRQVDLLLQAGKIKKIVVSYPNARGITIHKTIIMLSEVDPESDYINDLKKQIELSIVSPSVNYVVPEKVEQIEEEVGFANREVLEKFKRGSKRRKNRASAERLESADDKRRRKRKRNRRVEDLVEGDKQQRVSDEEPSGAASEDEANDHDNSSLKIIVQDFPGAEVSSQLPASGELFFLPPGQVEEPATPSTAVADSLENKKAKRKSAKKVAVPKEPKQQKEKPKKKPAKRDPVTGRIIRTKSTHYKNLDQDMFYRVVVVVRALFTCSGGSINWQKVAESMHPFTDEKEIPPSDVAKSKWFKIRDRYGGASQAVKAGKRFEKLFEAAYRDGVFPVVESPDDYDVPAYTKYWKEHDTQLQELTIPWLASTRKDVEKDFEIVVPPPQDSLESVWTSPSMVKTDEIMTNTSFSIAKYDYEEHEEDGEMAELKGLIKAITATSDENHNPALSKQLLDPYGVAKCELAIKQLEKEQRAIVYMHKDRTNMKPGRNFTFSDKFNHQFFTKYEENVLEEATKFEESLVSTISNQKGLVMSRAAPDSSIVSVLELTCHNMLKLLRVNTKSIEAVFPGKGYLSRPADKDKVDCDIIWKGNDGVEIPSVERLDIDIPMSEKPGGHIWTDITGQLSESIWRKIVKAILWLIVLRPGITPQAIHLKMRVALRLNEVELVLKYLSDRQNITKGDCDGYFPQARWYYKVFE